MTRRIIILASWMILILGAMQLRAHDEFRIVGTLTKLENAKLTVEDKDGKIVSIARTKYTTYWRDKKKVEAKELKRGSGVVVDATGDSYKDLVAITVTIVPPITPSQTK